MRGVRPTPNVAEFFRHEVSGAMVTDAIPGEMEVRKANSCWSPTLAFGKWKLRAVACVHEGSLREYEGRICGVLLRLYEPALRGMKEMGMPVDDIFEAAKTPVANS